MAQPNYKNFNQERVIGEHTIYLPDPPNIKKIHYKDLPQDKQFFRREFLPNNWNLLPKEDRNEFANRHWDIRGREGEKGEGFWFMNNGNIEWMSPTHFFYSNWWRIGKVKIPKEYIFDARDAYYPFFTDADRDWHYLADDCYWDASCGGLFTIEGRRMGKTYRVGCFQYEKVSKTHDSKGGIQSRDDTDSYNVFEKIIFGWRNLPPFFKPVDTGNTNPATELVFDEPKKISTKSQIKVYSDILHSWIDYGNASEGYYDGKEQIINIQDEIGKIAVKRGVNLLERIRVVVECCFIMGEKVGMVLGTTTVEEMEKAGGKQAKDLYLRCTTLDLEAKLNTDIYPDGKALDEFGFTNAKLKRYLKPSYKGFLGKNGKEANAVMLVDRYGYSNEELGQEYFNKRRANLKGAALSSERRKFPTCIADCWVSDTKNATFDTDKIEHQLEYNTTLPKGIVIRGNFMWQGGIKDTIVVWHPCDNGRWLVTWMPKVEERNKWLIKRGKKFPANTEIGCFGTDPYDDKFTYDNRKSDGASYGYWKFDVFHPTESGNLISEYVNRPPEPEIFYEDMIMQCVFYGWQNHIEKNKIGCINYFRLRGYYEYLMDRPEETQTTINPNKEVEKGTPMSGQEARQSLIGATESFVAKKVGMIHEEGEEPRMGRCYFNRYLNSLLEFDFGMDWTKFDCMVAGGFSLLGARKYIPKKKEPQKRMNFPKYDTTGTVSKLITTNTPNKPNIQKTNIPLRKY